jgi:hypothetical protein
VLYEGALCDDLTQVACNGDSSGEDGCQAYYSSITNFPITQGDTYYIRIGGWNAATGNGTLHLNTP